MDNLELAEKIKNATPSEEIVVRGEAQRELAYIAARRLGRDDLTFKVVK